MPRIVIVGGVGFVGHHLALSLKRDVTCIDSLTVNNLFSLLSPASEAPAAHVELARIRLALLKQAGIPVIMEDARDYHRLSYAIAPIYQGRLRVFFLKHGLWRLLAIRHR